MADDVRLTLRKALAKLTSEKMLVDRQIFALETALGGRSRVKSTRRKRRRISLAARKAIGRRMKAYWASRRAKTQPKPTMKTKSR
jgi:hypothetical protein